MKFVRTAIDAVGLAERVARFRARSIKKEAKVAAIELAMSMLDLTTLEGMDSPGKVRQLCAKARTLDPRFPELPRVAAVCVYPSLVRVAKAALADTGVHVASVATHFPSGQGDLKSRLRDVAFAVSEGADEIDMVISRGEFLRGNLKAVSHEIAEVKKACGTAHLKVILETGELGTYENVRLASDLAIAAGADFIKTSTGKVQPAATLEVTLVMLQAIRDHYEHTGVRIGMKPAGGIRDTKTAIAYLVMVREVLGPEWMDPALFRFGASTLANDLLMQWVKEREGYYTSPVYFTQD